MVIQWVLVVLAIWAPPSVLTPLNRPVGKSVMQVCEVTGVARDHALMVLMAHSWNREDCLADMLEDPSKALAKVSLSFSLWYNPFIAFTCVHSVPSFRLAAARKVVRCSLLKSGSALCAWRMRVRSCRFGANIGPALGAGQSM